MDAPLLESLEGSGVFCFNWRARADSYSAVFIREGLERESVGTALQAQPWILNIIQLQLSDQLFFFSTGNVDEIRARWGLTYLPLASFCPWNRSPWHISVPLCCATCLPASGIWFECWGHRLCQGPLLFRLGLGTVRCPRQTRALNVDLHGSCGLPEARVMPLRCCINAFPFSLWGDAQVCFGPFLFSLVIQTHKCCIFWCICVFCLEPSVLSKYNRKTDGKLWTSGPNLCLPLFPKQPNCKLQSINISQRGS